MSLKDLFYTPKGNKIIAFSTVGIICLVFFTVHICAIDFTDVLPPCSFYAATGFKCCGCGGTRCVQALTHFNFLTAFYYNPYIVIALVVVFIVFIKYMLNAFSKEYKKPKYDINIVTAILLPVSIVAFAIIRNTQFYSAFFY